jgi:adsorption protein B
MPLDSLDIVMQWLAYPVSGGILLNQLDELFMDGSYLLRGLDRRSRRVVSKKALTDVRQKRIAILIPAWKESDVIERMIEHNLASIDYDRDNYDIFCGTYQNDPETQACVARLARRFPTVHKVVVPHDGPTCKADCLNWVYQGAVLEEQRGRLRFDVLLMHDAEDIIHPLSLRLYSLLIPKYEFVQTPVFSLELKPGQFVAGTYIDEFAEHHLKDMKVREAISGLVPSAGVGSAFDRRAFEEIALSHGQQPFNPSSLTEDYDIGLRFRLANKRVAFACHTVEQEVLVPRGALGLARDLLRIDGLRAAARKLRVDGFGRREETCGPSMTPVQREEYIATREYFPAGFNASIRQRSRWILGITLQAWEQNGWKGTLPVLYCMWRDRKGLFTNLMVLCAYAFLAYVLGRSAIAAVTGSSWLLADLIPPGGLLYLLLAINLGTLLWRGWVKLHFVRALYGLLQGVLIFPRLVVGNVISVCATIRAVRMYLRHRITGQPLRWLKTAHAFPSAEVLSARRQLLGELLLERGAIVARDLEVALCLQKCLDLPLGEILTVSGALSERGVVLGLAEQFHMRAQNPDAAAVSLSLLAKLPEIEAEEIDVLPLSGGEDGTAAVVAMSGPISKDQRTRLERRLAAPVEAVLATKRAVQRARSLAYRRLAGLAPSRPLLGERLVQQGIVARGALAGLLEEQVETGEMLGELLLRKGLVTTEALAKALEPEGGFLRVAMGAGDPLAVQRLGYGYCQFYSLVPLQHVRRSGGPVVATAYPLHSQEQTVLSERLGEPVHAVLASRLEIRVALVRAKRSAALAVGLEAEAPIIARLRPGIQKSGAIDPNLAAEVTAEILGLSLVPAPSTLAATRPSVGLPLGLVRRHGIEVLEAASGSLVLAASRPSAALTREVAEILPGWRIAWQVVPYAERRDSNDRAA